MELIDTTEVYKNGNTMIPSELRKDYDLDEKYLVEWIKNDDGKIEINFRKREEFRDIIGKFKSQEKTNAVCDVENIYK